MTSLLAPAKLTWTLRVTGVRPDGYHLLDAEMVALDLADRLTISAPSLHGTTVEVQALGPGCADGVPADDSNLVVAALAAAGRSAAVRIEKAIPPGAGLGGGSADAAAVLRWAGITDPTVAAQIGADVAFCLAGGRARVTGVGDVVEPLPFVERLVTLVTPPVAVSTPAVYARWDAMGGPEGAAGNDLEPAAVAEEPSLVRWRAVMGDATGVTPRLAGSGSTWWVEGDHSATLLTAQWPDGPPPRLVAVARTVPAGWPTPLSDPPV